MSDNNKTARPPPLFPAPRPQPGIPTRHLQPPQRKSEDDPVAVRLAELEAERVQNELKIAEFEAKRLEDQVKLAELELKLKLAEQQPEIKEASPVSRGAGLVLQIKDWDKATKFIVSITALISAFSLALGLKNNAEKAPVPDVVKVATEVKDVKRVVTGETDLKGASSEGEDLSSKVNKLQSQVAPLVSSSCPRAQWWKAVLSRAKPPIIVELPEECSGKLSSISVEIQEGQQLPGRGPTAIHVKTPMPAP